MGMFKEFRDFAMRGNVVDLAVGVVIGGAFGKIVASLVDQIIMPPIGWMTGGIDFSELKWVLKPADVSNPAHKVAEVAIQYGAFI
ncbi:MAG: large conductance mechanosensitive channel protein MscL, partial [Rhodanobacter sp.]